MLSEKSLHCRFIGSLIHCMVNDRYEKIIGEIYGTPKHVHARNLGLDFKGKIPQKRKKHRIPPNPFQT